MPKGSGQSSSQPISPEAANSTSNRRRITAAPAVDPSTVCLQRMDRQWLIAHEHISFPIDASNWTAIVDAVA